jgi:hypothetical protein
MGVLEEGQHQPVIGRSTFAAAAHSGRIVT